MINIEKIRLYPKGFVFTEKHPITVPDHFRKLLIIDKYYYYFDMDSEYNIYEKDGNFILIHGHYVHISEDGKTRTDILTDLLEFYISDYNVFLNTLDFIGGRFALIIGNRDNVQIYPDASHSRSVYYSEGSVTASSHINLLASIENSTINNITTKISLLRNHWNSTPFNGLKSLNPNFTLNLHTKKRVRFFPREANKYSSWTHSEKLELLNTLWKSNMKHYNDTYDNIVLSITGGFDSRIMLAMAREYIHNLKFFTYSTTEGENETTKYARVLSVDQYVVNQMLKDIELDHRFFYTDQKKFKFSKEQRSVLDKNTIGNNGKFLLNFYLYAFPEKNVMHIRGTLIEIGRAYYSKYHENSVESIHKNFLNAIKTDFNNIPNENLNNLVSEYTTLFGYDKIIFDYHSLDLYYWENRMGRWHPEILNENDICFDTFLPLNVRAMLDITLSYTREERIKGFVFEELINKNYPILNFYGKNEKENLYEKERNRFIESFDVNKTNKTNKAFQSTESGNNNLSKSFIEHMRIYENDNLISQVNVSNNSLYVPLKHLKNNKYVKTEYIFSKSSGTLKIEYLNSYCNEQAKNYVNMEIYLNSRKVLEEDISEWNNEITVEIYNVKKNDVISLVLRPLRNIGGRSWEKATRYTINNIVEKQSNLISPVQIVSTNPYAKIY